MIKMYVLPEIAVVDKDFKDSLVISVVSPGREHPNIIGEYVYKFHFHDVTEVYEYNDGRLIQPMSRTIAKEIAEVAMNHRYLTEWIVHCEAGISRSPAVAIALSKFVKLNPNRRNLKKMFPLFNKHVCQLIEEEMEEKMKELESQIELDSKCGGEE